MSARDQPMATSTDDGSARAPAAAQPVWDAAVRVFHWTLVALVVTSWITGGSGERLHEVVGSAVAGLIVFRVGWGLVGTRHARFRDFVRGPSSIAGYLAGIAKLRPAHYTGHNPAGAAMIVALLVVLVTVIVTGFMMQTTRFFGIEWVESVHSVAADSLFVLVPLHVLGALVSSWLHQENLVGAMFSGSKHVPPGHPVATEHERLEFRLKGTQGLFGLLLLAAVGAVYGWVSTEGRSEPGSASASASVTASAASAEGAPATGIPAEDVSVAVAVAPTQPQAQGTQAQGQGQTAQPQRPLVDLQDYMTGGPEQPSQLWILASGGRLYDRWYAALGKKGPTANHPSWPAENTNVAGAETWRCKNCHGWDYMGLDGHLKSGAGATGIRGLQRARGRSVEDLVAVLENSTHRYTDDLIPGHAKRRLAAFVSQGQHNATLYVEPNGKVKGNVANGHNLFQTVCAACHGFEGKARKLGPSSHPDYVGKPIYVGTKARSVPIEVLHKIRNGHPGAPMISLRGLGMQAAVDVLAYTQQLPAE